jgi:hypothetical protein
MKMSSKIIGSLAIEVVAHKATFSYQIGFLVSIWERRPHMIVKNPSLCIFTLLPHIYNFPKPFT